MTSGAQPLRVRQGSLRQRLLILLLAGAAILTICVYFVVLSVARQVAQASQDNVLAASAISILDSARFSGGEVKVDLPYAALSMLGTVSDERVFYAIRLDNAFLSGYPDLPEASEIGETVFRSGTILNARVRMVSMDRSFATDIGQQTLQVTVAQTVSGQDKIIAGISRTSLAIGGTLFVLLVLLAGLIARSTIRPLDRLAASVSRRGPTDLRPVSAPVPLEMVPLVAALNRLMARLQTSLTRSEDFIAEAAHRVRTPLAILRTKAEIFHRRATDADTRHAVGEMIRAIDDSSRTAGQLLDHAMVTFRLDDLKTEAIDLAQLARSAVDRVQPLADMREIEIHVSALAPLQTAGDPILLQNALQNLLDNAIKYAPPGARIDLDVTAEGDEGILTVRDTGPGFPEPDVADLTERFSRGANARGIAGSGLGLTIVREVMDAHRGHMETSNQPGGGACVRLFFPLL